MYNRPLPPLVGAITALFSSRVYLSPLHLNVHFGNRTVHVPVRELLIFPLSPRSWRCVRVRERFGHVGTRDRLRRNITLAEYTRQSLVFLSADSSRCHQPGVRLTLPAFSGTHTFWRGHRHTYLAAQSPERSADGSWINSTNSFAPAFRFGNPPVPLKFRIVELAAFCSATSFFNRAQRPTIHLGDSRAILTPVRCRPPSMPAGRDSSMADIGRAIPVKPRCALLAHGTPIYRTCPVRYPRDCRRTPRPTGPVCTGPPPMASKSPPANSCVSCSDAFQVCRARFFAPSKHHFPGSLPVASPLHAPQRIECRRQRYIAPLFQPPELSAP